MKCKFTLFIIFFSAAHLYAQTPVDSLWRSAQKSVSSAEKSDIHWQLAAYWAAEQQPDSVKNHIDIMLSYAQKAGGKALPESLTKANEMLMQIGDFDYAQQLNSHYLAQFREENNTYAMAACYSWIGRLQLFMGQVEEADSSLTQAYRLAAGNNKLRSSISINLGALYRWQSRYTDALQVLTDALAITDSAQNPLDYSGLLFTIGNVYGQINDFNTSLVYFERVANIARNSKDSLSEANVLINIATSYSNLEQYASAETNARQSLAIVQGKNLMAESEVLSVLTDILLKAGKHAELPGFYQRMYELADLTGNVFYKHLADIGMAQLAYNNGDYHNAIAKLTHTLPLLEQQGGWLETLSGYKVLYQSYHKTGDYKNALSAMEKYYAYRDSSYNQDKVKELALLQSKLDFQKQELEFEAEKRVRNIVIIALAFIFCIGIVAAVWIFKNRQKINRQKQQLLHSQLEIAEHNLNIAELKLSDFASRIQEKTKLLNDMEQQMVLLQHNDDSELLTRLQQVTILTEDDWQDFKTLFERVHSGYLYRLKEKYPEISPAETRYLSLAKLNFSTKEMAAALGVSPQSIRTNWYRIRKKLDLPELLTVEELIADI